MTEQDRILLDDFKAKLRLLIRRHDHLRTEKRQLEEQIVVLKNEMTALRIENERLVKMYDNLKIAKVLSVADVERRQVKLRINQIVREIDKCIAQLNV